MSANDANWTKLREFRAVDLAASYVLSWELSRGSLRIDLDLCLLPEHPFYETPRPKEKACIRAALLEFPQLSRLVAASRAPACTTAGELAAGLPGGRIRDLNLIDDGRYDLQGAFGTVEIHAGRPILRLKGHTR